MGKLGRAIRLAWGLGGVFFAAVKACMTHRITSMSAALAFCTLFSMAPILVLVMATAGFLLGAQAAQGAIAAQLQAVMGATGARAIQNLVAGAQVPGSGARATTIAVVLLAVGATALAILASFWEGLWAGSYWIFYSLSALFTFTVIACLFAVIYKMLPEVALPWSDVTIGALCTATLFSLGEYAIAAYLRSGGITTSLGAAGSLAVLLIWVYFSALVFFLGAEFTREYALTFGSLRGQRRP